MSPIINPSGGGGGGSQPRTATAIVATNPNTFAAPLHVFDLGSAGPHMVQLTITGLVLTPDGETFGNDPGMIYAGPGSATTKLRTSADNVTYAVIQAGQDLGASFEVQALATPESTVVLCGRYLEVPTVIVENSTGAIYAGANHPAATVRYDLIYL